jgi:hypothetical protein
MFDPVHVTSNAEAIAIVTKWIVIQLLGMMAVMSVAAFRNGESKS